MGRSRLRAILRPLRRGARRWLHRGRRRYCPVCDSHLSRFRPGGVVPRAEACCPVCGALERHRLVWAFFAGRTDLFDGRPKRMLHLAPEPQFRGLLGRTPGLEYRTADLDDPAAMLHMDVTAIPYPADAFDVIYCSHVLEHVADDRRAMRELCRVLRPDGWAVLQVPITAERTFEDPSVRDPRQRERLFGQRDHLRRYGPDYRERLEQAGFRVERFPPAAVVGAADGKRLGVSREDPIHYCVKARPSGR